MTDLAKNVKKVKEEVASDHVTMLASGLSYRLVFAVFPLFLLLVSLASIFAGPDLIQEALGYLDTGVPSEVDLLLSDQILSLTSDQAKPALSIGAVFSASLALWAISGLFRSVMECMNIVYDTEESRGLVKRYATSFILAILSVVLFLGSFVAVVLLNIWIALPALALLVMAGFASIYYFAPDEKVKKFRLITPGTIFTTLMWVIFSVGFSVYVDNFGSYNETYGTLAGIILFLLYTYFSSVILLVGAEVNQIYKDKKFLL